MIFGLLIFFTKAPKLTLSLNEDRSPTSIPKEARSLEDNPFSPLPVGQAEAPWYKDI